MLRERQAVVKDNPSCMGLLFSHAWQITSREVLQRAAISSHTTPIASHRGRLRKLGIVTHLLIVVFGSSFGPRTSTVIPLISASAHPSGPHSVPSNSSELHPGCFSEEDYGRRGRRRQGKSDKGQGEGTGRCQNGMVSGTFPEAVRVHTPESVSQEQLSVASGGAAESEGWQSVKGAKGRQPEDGGQTTAPSSRFRLPLPAPDRCVSGVTFLRGNDNAGLRGEKAVLSCQFPAPSSPSEICVNRRNRRIRKQLSVRTYLDGRKIFRPYGLRPTASSLLSSVVRRPFSASLGVLCGEKAVVGSP